MHLFIWVSLRLDSRAIVDWLQNHIGMFECMNANKQCPTPQSHCRRTTRRQSILLTLEITPEQCEGGTEEDGVAQAYTDYIRNWQSQNGLEAVFKNQMRRDVSSKFILFKASFSPTKRFESKLWSAVMHRRCSIRGGKKSQHESPLPPNTCHKFGDLFGINVSMEGE